MIRVEKIVKTYGTGESCTQALREVSLEVGDGECLAVLGASGSGKSTLLYLVSGLERPDSGSVRYDGEEITTLSEKDLTAFRKRTVGFVFQQYYLLPHLNVEKNVKMGAELAGNGDYAELIRAVGLEEKAKKFPHELSGGEQQRVALARALAKHPKVLFLDEPTGALDEETGRQVLDLILRLQKERGFTVVMVTHNRNIAETADRVICMKSGRIAETFVNQTRKTAFEIGW